MCATKWFAIHTIVMNRRTSLQCIHHDNQI